MTHQPPRSYGRAALLGVLIALVLTVCAAVYVYVARYGTSGLTVSVGLDDPDAEKQRLARHMTLLLILLVSALLILLFVIGAYLVIRVGRIVRTPVGGRPTEYVDAWQSYRLTEEQIAAATSEPPNTADEDDAGPAGQEKPDS